MVCRRFHMIRILASSLLVVLFLALLSGCVTTKQALFLEKRANCALMKGLQDNDEDVVQIEDGTGAVGEAAACPT